MDFLPVRGFGSVVKEGALVPKKSATLHRNKESRIDTGTVGTESTTIIDQDTGQYSSQGIVRHLNHVYRETHPEVVSIVAAEVIDPASSVRVNGESTASQDIT